MQDYIHKTLKRIYDECEKAQQRDDTTPVRALSSRFNDTLDKANISI